MHAAVAEPILIDEGALHLSASIGIAVFPDDIGGAVTLINQADAAMYRAKRSGRGGVASFDIRQDVRTESVPLGIGGASVRNLTR